MNYRRWLEIAEYVSLFCSVVGSVVAVVSGQIIYACAPLSLSISLNLINRYRLQQQTQQRQQRISKQLQSLRQQIKSISTDIAQLQNQYTRLEQSLASVKHDLALVVKEAAQNDNLLELYVDNADDEDDEDLDALLDTLD